MNKQDIETMNEADAKRLLNKLLRAEEKFGADERRKTELRRVKKRLASLKASE